MRTCAFYVRGCDTGLYSVQFCWFLVCCLVQQSFLTFAISKTVCLKNNSGSKTTSTFKKSSPSAYRYFQMEMRSWRRQWKRSCGILRKTSMSLHSGKVSVMPVAGQLQMGQQDKQTSPLCSWFWTLLLQVLPECFLP